MFRFVLFADQSQVHVIIQPWFHVCLLHNFFTNTIKSREYFFHFFF